MWSHKLNGFAIGAGCSLMCALSPLQAFATTIIADSVADFSGVQGQDNWYYGYYSGALTPSTFQQMSNFNTNWTVNFNQYWTTLTQMGGHPNGVAGGKMPVEQWATRRWVSEVNGQVTLSGNIASLDGGGGNGIIARIFVGNSEIFNVNSSYFDPSGYQYSLVANVTAGTPIDFVIDPKLANELYDTTRFTAQVAAVPEPEIYAMILGGLGFVGAYARRRKVMSN